MVGCLPERQDLENQISSMVSRFRMDTMLGNICVEVGNGLRTHEGAYQTGSWRGELFAMGHAPGVREGAEEFESLFRECQGIPRETSIGVVGWNAERRGPGC